MEHTGLVHSEFHTFFKLCTLAGNIPEEEKTMLSMLSGRRTLGQGSQDAMLAPQARAVISPAVLFSRAHNIH